MTYQKRPWFLACGKRIFVHDSAHSFQTRKLNGQRASAWDANSGNFVAGLSYWGSVPLNFYMGGSSYYRHFDWLQTERMRTTYNGSVAGTLTSFPFGDGVNGSGGSIPFQFAGTDQDSSSNDHAKFREYSDMAGLWMSPDPSSGSYDFSNPQSLNRYSYVMNDPLSVTDPQGLDGCGEGGPGCGPPSFPPIGICLIFCSGGGGVGSFHGSLKPRPDDQPWDEYHIHYGPNIAAALGLPDETCDFGLCGPDPTAVEPGGVAGNAAPIDLSAWVFQIYAFARALNGSAPNGLTSKRQACIEQARLTLNNKTVDIQRGYKRDLGIGLIGGAAQFPVFGCIGGAIATFPELSPEGCVVGAFVATNPVSLTVGAVQGGFVATAADIGRVLWAKYQYQQQVAVCSSLPN